MPPTIDLENDVILGENAKAAEQASSDLKSLEGLSMDELTEDQIQLIASSGDFTTLHNRNNDLVRPRSSCFGLFLQTRSTISRATVAVQDSHYRCSACLRARSE
jgi:hypothetical protein